MKIIYIEFGQKKSKSQELQLCDPPYTCIFMGNLKTKFQGG